MTRQRSIALALAASMLALASCSRSQTPASSSARSSNPAAAEPAVADFYRGKTVRLIVGFSPGGGYDTYTRLIARYLGTYIPGNPNVIVENLPGAGSIIAANQTYNSLPKDGTVVANIGGPLVTEQLFQTDGVEYDASKFWYLAVPVKETYVLIVHSRTGITKLDDVTGPNAKTLVLAGIPNSAVEQGAYMMREALGANIRVVSGYEGTAPVRLAIDSGEVDGFVNSWQSVKLTNLDDVKDGTWTVLADINDHPTKDLPFPAPTINDIGKTDEMRQLIKLGILYPNQFGKVYVAAPEVPADRAAALQEAFRQTFADKGFLAEAESARLEIDPFFGDDIKKLVLEMLATPDDLRARLKAIIKP